ncbi:MAG: hypothetical protein K2Y56_00850 [Methylobacterium sp.]|uniref:hypothetical protein n=1 Tax=Methylobacterium sp. TaxID=409 RepID=UPI0025D3CBCC|nr:hypothetical protein [Methylobacterium sp.]MBX9930086.1 hypothetical protein [Methylobacterium sp.]
MRRLRHDILLAAALAVLLVAAIHASDDRPPPLPPAPRPMAALAAELRTNERQPVRIVYQPLIETR